MNKTFIVQNLNKEKLGEVIISKAGFKLKGFIAKLDEKLLSDILAELFQRGVSVIGDVVLADPIKPGDKLFLNEIKNQLAQKRYFLIEKNK